jgi:hypothetical protein
VKLRVIHYEFRQLEFAMDPRGFRHRLGEVLEAASLDDLDVPVIAIAQRRLCILGMFVCVLQAKVYC